MRTIRDHIASQSAVPDPPPGATHALVWEPYGPSRARWALVDLDAHPDAEEAAFLDGPLGLSAKELTQGVSGLLGRPAGLSSPIEVDGEVGYYVTLGGGTR